MSAKATAIAVVVSGKSKGKPKKAATKTNKRKKEHKDDDGRAKKKIKVAVIIEHVEHKEGKKKSNAKPKGWKKFKDDKKTLRCQAPTTEGVQCTHQVAEGRRNYCDKHGD